MLSKLREREEGFTLIELLVVVIIIGILAAIAIPVFMNQREKAWRGAAESDVRNAALNVESYYSDKGSYPANGTSLIDDAGTAMDGNATVTSEGVTLTYSLAGSDYCIVAEHDELTDTTPDATYKSAAGGVVKPAEAC